MSERISHAEQLEHRVQRSRAWSGSMSPSRRIWSVHWRRLGERCATSRARLRQIEATQEGYAVLLSWLATWHAGAGPAAVLIGLEATGVLWEPLYDALIQAG
jgi:hypothetical protein